MTRAELQTRNDQVRRRTDLPEDERESVAQMIGMGALAYAMLSVDNNKDIVFHID